MSLEVYVKKEGTDIYSAPFCSQGDVSLSWSIPAKKLGLPIIRSFDPDGAIIPCDKLPDLLRELDALETYWEECGYNHQTIGSPVSLPENLMKVLEMPCTVAMSVIAFSRLEPSHFFPSARARLSLRHDRRGQGHGISINVLFLHVADLLLNADHARRKRVVLL